MAGKRLSDKTEPFKIIISILSPILLLLLGYIITSNNSTNKNGFTNINERLDKIESKQDELSKSIIKNNEKCTKQINTVRIDAHKEMANKYDQLKDWLIAKIEEIK